MSSVRLHRVAVLSPFASYLSGLGGAVERGFREARLPVSALENINNYVPSLRFYEFVANMAQREGIEDLGFRVGEKYGANCVDPRMTRLLRQSQTLFRGLRKASDLTNRTISRCRMGLARSADDGLTYLFHKPGCRYANVASDQIAWFGLMTMIGMVRVYAGPDWRPTKIGVMSRRRPSDYIFDQLPNTRIELSRPWSYVAMSKETISLVPRTTGAPENGPVLVNLDPVDKSLIGSLKQALGAYIGDSISIQMAAEICNTSSRTLQRQLTRRGVTFRRVLDEVRFDVARGMLADSDVAISDISARLGYTNATNFTRSFRRFWGVSPTEFRRINAPRRAIQ